MTYLNQTLGQSLLLITHFFSKCHVIKISKIFGDFVPRDPAFARVFSRRSAISKIVEEKALGTRLPFVRDCTIAVVSYVADMSSDVM